MFLGRTRIFQRGRAQPPTSHFDGYLECQAKQPAQVTAQSRAEAERRVRAELQARLKDGYVVRMPRRSCIVVIADVCTEKP